MVTMSTYAKKIGSELRVRPSQVDAAVASATGSATGASAGSGGTAVSSFEGDSGSAAG